MDARPSHIFENESTKGIEMKLGL